MLISVYNNEKIIWLGDSWALMITYLYHIPFSSVYGVVSFLSISSFGIIDMKCSTLYRHSASYNCDRLLNLTDYFTPGSVSMCLKLVHISRII